MNLERPHKNSHCPYCGAPEFSRDDEVGWIRWECNSWIYLRDGAFYHFFFFYGDCGVSESGHYLFLFVGAFWVQPPAFGLSRLWSRFHKKPY